MTTTACDDQFVSNTEKHIAMYSIVDILRRNVADLEIALRKQTGRAEAAEAELLAIREDNHSMMLEIHNLRIERDSLAAELAKLREQKPVAWMREDGNLYLAWQKDLCLPEVRFSPLYAAPVPAVAAPAVPAEFFTWVAAYGDYIEKLDVYNKKLTISKTLPFPGLDMNDEFQAFSAAQRKAHRMLPDLFEKARALLQSTSTGEQK